MYRDEKFEKNILKRSGAYEKFACIPSFEMLEQSLQMLTGTANKSDFTFNYLR